MVLKSRLRLSGETFEEYGILDTMLMSYNTTLVLEIPMVVVVIAIGRGM